MPPRWLRLVGTTIGFSRRIIPMYRTTPSLWGSRNRAGSVADWEASSDRENRPTTL